MSSTPNGAVTTSRGDSAPAPRHERAWPLIETRHLATLCVVASSRSFRQAAATLGYTQSAVSQHIATLERRVGARLVERSRAGVVAPTPAGELLVHHAEGILARLRAADADMRGVPYDPEAGPRIVTTPGPAARLAATWVGRMAASHGPPVSWSEVATAAQMQDILLTGRADVGIADIPALASKALVAVGLASSPLALASASGEQLPERGGTEALAGRTLAAYRSCRASDDAVALLAVLGVALGQIVRSDDGGVIAEIMRARGIGLLPTDLLPPDARRIEVAVELPSATFAVVKHRATRLDSHLEAAIAESLGGAERSSHQAVHEKSAGAIT